MDIRTDRVSPSLTNKLPGAGVQTSYVHSRIILLLLCDHKRNASIRHQTGVNDVIDAIKKGIHGWAGHIARFNDNRWNKRVTEWTPREWTRRQGRPKTRWRDNLIRHMGPAWPRIARDRRLWKLFRKGFRLIE